MYSKVLEIELSSCIGSSNLSLGSIIYKLKKENKLSSFVEDIDKYKIVELRNNAAHKESIDRNVIK